MTQKSTLISLIRGSSIMTTVGILGGILGYAYQIIMGRMLSSFEFALFSAVMALYVFTNSPLNAVTMAISRQVSACVALGDKVAIRMLFVKSYRGLLIGFGPAFIIFFLMAPWLQECLKSPTSAPVWFCGAILFCMTAVGVATAFMQALKQFLVLGAAVLTSHILKIGFSVFLVVLGFKASGALAGVFLAGLATCFFVVSFLYLRLKLKQSERELKAGVVRKKPYQISVRAVVPVLVANVAFTAMTQLDMVLANYYFDATTAGNYAAASVLGKAVLYLPGGMVFALFPMVAENFSKGESSSRLFIQAVSLTSIICFATALVYFFYSDWIIALFYGTRYMGASDILRWYGLAILPMALVLVAEHFLIAQGRVLFAWLFLAIAPFELLSIQIYHQEPLMVVAIIGTFGFVTMILGFGLLSCGYKGSSKDSKKRVEE